MLFSPIPQLPTPTTCLSPSYAEASQTQQHSLAPNTPLSPVSDTFVDNRTTPPEKGYQYHHQESSSILPNPPGCQTPLTLLQQVQSFLDNQEVDPRDWNIPVSDSEYSSFLLELDTPHILSVEDTESLRYDYDPQSSQLTLRCMPTPVHDNVQRFAHLMKEDMKMSEFIRDSEARYISVNSATNVSLPPRLERFPIAKGRVKQRPPASRQPDACYGYENYKNPSAFPRVVFEVAFKKPYETAKAAAEQWLVRSKGRVKLVVVINLEEGKPGEHKVKTEEEESKDGSDEASSDGAETSGDDGSVPVEEYYGSDHASVSSGGILDILPVEGLEGTMWGGSRGSYDDDEAQTPETFLSATEENHGDINSTSVDTKVESPADSKIPIGEQYHDSVSPSIAHSVGSPTYFDDENEKRPILVESELLLKSETPTGSSSPLSSPGSTWSTQSSNSSVSSDVGTYESFLTNGDHSKWVGPISGFIELYRYNKLTDKMYMDGEQVDLFPESETPQDNAPHIRITDLLPAHCKDTRSYQMPIHHFRETMYRLAIPRLALLRWSRNVETEEDKTQKRKFEGSDDDFEPESEGYGSDLKLPRRSLRRRKKIDYGIRPVDLDEEL